MPESLCLNKHIGFFILDKAKMHGDEEFIIYK